MQRGSARPENARLPPTADLIPIAQEKFGALFVAGFFAVFFSVIVSCPPARPMALSGASRRKQIPGSQQAIDYTKLREAAKDRLRGE
jgi:hypothetical protein